jgi:glycosyltransferase involved in cell wall biosynthesis
LPSSIRVEHIIQDAGTPGIEELARELGAEFYRDGQLIFHAKECGLGVQPAILQSSSNQAANDSFLTNKFHSPYKKHDAKCHFRSVSSVRSVVDSSPTAPDQAHYSLKIFSEKDAGMYDAINRGLARSNGEICAYLNSDEQYLPGTLDEVWKFFRQNSLAQILFGDVILVDSDGGYLCTRIVTIPSKWLTRVHTLSVFTAATFFRRSLFADRKIFFRSEWKVIGDLIWILDILSAKTSMGLMSKRVAVATETGANLILSEQSRIESSRFFSSSPWLLKAIKPILVLQYRFKRLMYGAYRPPLETYRIYTREIKEQRTIFRPVKSTYKLEGRFG